MISTFIIYVVPIFRKYAGLRTAGLRHHSLHEGDVELRGLRLRVNLKLFSANVPNTQVVHPAWPTMWPRLLTDGKTAEYKPENLIYQTPYDYQFLRPLTKKNKQFLWEC